MRYRLADWLAARELVHGAGDRERNGHGLRGGTHAYDTGRWRYESRLRAWIETQEDAREHDEPPPPGLA